MSTLRTEGIVLQAIKYQDYDQILTVFTPGEGIIKFFVKAAYSSKNGRGAATSPLSRAEFVYSKGKSDLYSCREVSSLNPHLALRQSIVMLETALDLIKAVLESQMENKPAPDLYKLLLSYLEKIPVIANPMVLAASFRLKILRHDGLLDIGPCCSICEAPLHDRYTSGGDSYCAPHAPLNAQKFAGNEMELIQQLAFTRSFKDLFAANITHDFNQKIRQMFTELVQS